MRRCELVALFLGGANKPNRVTECKAIATFAISAFDIKSVSIGINITHSQDTASAFRRVNLSFLCASPLAHPAVRQGMNSLSNSESPLKED